MLIGRLGLETALPHSDRHGPIYLDRGRIAVEDGCLRFCRAGGGGTPASEYAIPNQSTSLVLLAPGSMVSYDALRLLARHDAGLAAVGEDGVRFYTAPPLLPDFPPSRSVRCNCGPMRENGRLDVARRTYALRLGEILPHRDITVLRGIEGARVKSMYPLTAQRFAIEWRGGRYDRNDPDSADLPNQAINHIASAVEAVAAIAVAATATLPQLGFTHENGDPAGLELAQNSRRGRPIRKLFFDKVNGINLLTAIVSLPARGWTARIVRVNGITAVSPPARGWTRGARGAGYFARVPPARAGMDPVEKAAARSYCNFPARAGMDPVEKAAARSYCNFPRPCEDGSRLLNSSQALSLSCSSLSICFRS